MTARFSTPRGTQDILPAQWPVYDFVLQRFHHIAHLFAYGRIETPALGETSLFARTSGEGSDIVDHEMYTFQDRGGDALALRPEGTAPVMRAYLQHGMDRLAQPVKLFYVERMYRYERPQRGRLREHRQMGCEGIGSEDPHVDVEMIVLVQQLLHSLGLKEVVLQLNTIGDFQCRPDYVQRLVRHLEGHQDAMAPLDRERLHRNPLRVLDSKEPTTRNILVTAPQIHESLCVPCREHWNRVLRGLEDSGVKYQVNPHLVRGLDYYTRTVFEFIPPSAGSQGTLVAGGRYDALSEAMGGPHVPGIGFAAGVERLVQAVQESSPEKLEASHPFAFVAHVGGETEPAALQLTLRLRQQGIPVEVAFGSRSLKAQMRQAHNSGARYVLILGNDEFASGQVMVRRLEDGAQELIGQSAAQTVLLREIVG